jgi:deazaflavin-dependent oxidoreductase (nitroreductase family)
MTTTHPTPPVGGSWRLARLTAPMARAFAGRRFFPIWAVVHHRGRKTGRDLSVPVAVRANSDAFLIALPWGPGTNWARNVLAAGGCTIRWKGADYRVTGPEVLGQSQARPYFSRAMWFVVQRGIHAEAFLLLHRQA